MGGRLCATVLATVGGVFVSKENVRVTRALPLGGVSSYLDVFARVNLASPRPPREGEIQLTLTGISHGIRTGSSAGSAAEAPCWQEVCTWRDERALLGPRATSSRWHRAVAGPRSWAVPCMAHDGLRSFVSRWLGEQPHSRSLPAGKLAALSAL